MATAEDVKKLAALARITVPEADLERFTQEFDSILAYVGQLEKLDIPADLVDRKPPVYNVLREDGFPQEGGTNTEKLTGAFPKSEDGYLAVKKILSND